MKNGIEWKVEWLNGTKWNEVSYDHLVAFKSVKLRWCELCGLVNCIPIFMHYMNICLRLFWSPFKCIGILVLDILKLLITFPFGACIRFWLFLSCVFFRLPKWRLFLGEEVWNAYFCSDIWNLHCISCLLLPLVDCFHWSCCVGGSSLHCFCLSGNFF